MKTQAVSTILPDVEDIAQNPDAFLGDDDLGGAVRGEFSGHNVFAEIFERSLMPMYVRVDMKIVTANQAMADLLGYASPDQLCQLPSVYEIISEDAKKRASTLLNRSDGDNSVRIWHSITLRHSDGSGVEVEAFRRSINWHGQHASYLVYRDIRKELNALSALAESEARLQTILDVSAHGLVVHKGGPIVYANAAFLNLIEVDGESEIIGKKNLFDYFLNTDRLIEYSQTRLAGGTAPECYEAELESSKGQHRIVEIRPSLLDWEGEPAVLACISDVTSERKLQRQIEYAANFDELSGLPNRRSFYKSLDQSIERVRKDSTCDILVYLDLDGFKVVNDSAGHAAGDLLLQQVAECLSHCLSKNDILARLGGDEFGVILKNMPVADSQSEIKRIIASLADYVFHLDGQSFIVGASAGVTAIKGDEFTRADYLRQADIACYAAKEKGRNQIYYFRESNKDSVRRQAEVHTAASLRDAIEGNRLRLFGQGIVDMTKAGDPIHHSEILVRMCDPKGNIIGPDVFIGAAERYRLTDDIDSWVIENTFKALAEEQRVSPTATHPRVSLNMSGATIGNLEITERIKGLLDQYEIDPTRICFEVTETAAIRSLNRATRFISAMREIGCRFSLDDFGTGLSSFGYLQDLNVNELKIDGRFVRNIISDPVSRAVVSAVCDVGRALNISVVAECVETRQIASLLRELGVRYGQGYLWSRPQPLQTLFVENANRQIE